MDIKQYTSAEIHSLKTKAQYLIDKELFSKLPLYCAYMIDANDKPVIAPINPITNKVVLTEQNKSYSLVEIFPESAITATLHELNKTTNKLSLNRFAAQLEENIQCLRIYCQLHKIKP